MTSPDRKHIVHELRDIVMELADSADPQVLLGEDESLSETGIDSMLRIHLLTRVERAFEVAFGDRELQFDRFDTIGHLADAILEKQTARLR